MRMSRTSPRRRSGCAPAAGGRGSDRQATRSPQTCSSATRPPPRAASMVARAPSSPPSERTRGASTRPSRRSQTPSSRRRRPKLNRRALLGGIRSFSSPCARCRSLSPRCSTSPRRSAARSSLFWLCLVYSLGFSLTNASFGAVNASFVDTVKAAEPISTVALAALFLSNEKMTPRVLLALLPIVGGVGISSMAEASASLIGLAFALGSNLCFSARSIAAKLVGKHMGAARMDGANLFVHVNILGLMALVPAALLLEGRQLAELASSLPDEQLVASARLFAFNGLMYYLNNQMNFIVLEQVDTLTHGIINCGRRVANILFAIMWFGNKVTVFNGAGISLAIAGGFLYVRAKVLDAKREKEAKKRAGRKSE
ncbi:triose-phosphate transporter family-domain-containing protein [Pavlovales sp. CCMP2436]|nr:triose-phosphate transporter family-domain-containing protein [Pavlovales sp. CCMP2436]